ncbi:XRN 5'-3' exonuclease [Yasminevirus sp. GU-2018]|uniref:XRN 5'-3' exonuclease n=1 Tax=Yasminevirus sp. GU-2018 TaxID=2420051 RepID=A0A5K0U9W4_9VIRU|nr:XRN 5'-3' exonuclease [Yasminevirus sp. GU-2018]
MGVVRLAKCLKLLNSLDEFKDRNSDVRNKIQGERVYMDFVSIVYKIQQAVSNELNYLLFSFYLMSYNLIDPVVLSSEKLLQMTMKYKQSVPRASEVIDSLKSLHSNLRNQKTKDTAVQTAMKELTKIVNGTEAPHTSTSDVQFIEEFKRLTRESNVMNEYVYESVIGFIVDLLTNKLANVEYVLIAFDGIPSFGKIQEQRQRRYMRHAFIEFQKTINDSGVKATDADSSEASTVQIKHDVLSVRDIYDRDHFQVDIRSAIDYVYGKYHSMDLQKNISDEINEVRKSDPVYLAKTGNKQSVVVDVIDKPYGEGEKILMDKLIQDYQVHKDTKSYVFYSPDGDSVILCLHIYIKTKVNALTVVKTFNQDPSDRHNESSQYVDIKVLYENIVKLIQKFTREEITDSEDKDRICGDFILMMNFFGNDFIHQVPTMEISSTFMDTMYIYSKFIMENDYLTFVQDDRVHINYASLIVFIKLLSEFEHMMMMDTYLSETDEKQKVMRYFGDLFPCRYLIDYRDNVTEIKKELHNKIKGTSVTVDDVKQMVLESIDKLNQIATVTNKKYGDIWTKIEVKNPYDYATKIVGNPHMLVSKYPRFIFHIRSKKKKDEEEIDELVKLIEKDLLAHGTPIDLDAVDESHESSVKNFSFEYSNIRLLTPHEQMPTTANDINIYLLEWRSGRWMHVLNGYSFEIGYDWKKGTPKKIEQEMKRYQYDVLGMNNTQMNRMILDYLRTLSWMVDYYMNTDYESTSTEISTWSFNYDRSPFISHIANYLSTISDTDLKSIMKNLYTRTLVPTENYLKSDRHRFYIYPQSTQIIERIPKEYKQYFPDMNLSIKKSVEQFNSLAEGGDSKKVNKDDRFFDCRMCPYFSKCVFKSDHLTFKELMSLDVSNILQYKILKRPVHLSGGSTNGSVNSSANSASLNISSTPNTPNRSSIKVDATPRQYIVRDSQGNLVRKSGVQPSGGNVNRGFKNDRRVVIKNRTLKVQDKSQDKSNDLTNQAFSSSSHIEI